MKKILLQTNPNEIWGKDPLYIFFDNVKIEISMEAPHPKFKLPYDPAIPLSGKNLDS